MYFHNGRAEQLNDLLNRIGEKLQLSKDMHEMVEKKYNEVYEVIKQNGEFSYEGTIYPQGSYAIQTTVKPLGRDDFDLDAVIQFDNFWNKQLDSKEILEEKLGKCLKEQYDTVELKIDV